LRNQQFLINNFAYKKEFLLSLYKKMLLIRLCEESFVEPILNKTIRCPVHLYSGQEAIAVGVSANLKQTDYVFGNHRSHGHYLAKGGNLQRLINEVFCRENGASRGRGGSMHLIDIENNFLGSAPIVGGTIALAVGAALAAKIESNGRIAVSYFGDGASGEGVLYESLNFASLKRLPIIFVCENNQYSTHMHISNILANTRIENIAKSFGINSVRVDGNNVLLVYETIKNAIGGCRRGKPFFLECITYRQRGHVGADDNIQGSHLEIRPKREIDEWKKRDPLIRYANLITRMGIVSKQSLRRMDASTRLRVKDCFKKAMSSAFPKPEGIYQYVYKKKNS